jgi:hypothetical protein
VTGDWATVVGTLGGAIVGAVAGLAGQRAQWKRRWDPSRHKTYAEFVAAEQRHHTALWGVAYARRHNHRLEDRWAEANLCYEVSNSLVEEVVLLATPATVVAARALSQCLRDFKDEIYKKTRLSEEEYAKTPLLTESEYQALYAPRRDAFIDAAKRELRVPAG